MKDFDVGIIGAGVAGAFATLKLAKDHKNIRAIVFDLGRPPMKRRRQLEGWLGCLPNSDGKLYQTDIGKVAQITGLRRAKSASTWFKHVIEQVDSYKIVKDRSPSAAMEKKIKKLGYDVLLNDYVQIYPKEVHALSKYMAETIEKNKNITFSFDNEVLRIAKQKNLFVITTESQEYRCKKIIVAVGRSGWRWAKELYSSFGIIDNNDTARFGIRVETNSSVMKEFNKSNCTLLKGDQIEIGPLSWYGTVIPEDHLDLAISAFRSNENRWKSDKVSFSLIGNRPFPGAGFEQTDRMGKLAFVLANDRVIKERISSIIAKKSRVSIIEEYDWLCPVIEELATVIPEITNKAYFHIPTIVPAAPRINIGDNLETEIEGMFVAGESAGVHGILAAGIMGIAAADAISR